MPVSSTEISSLATAAFPVGIGFTLILTCPSFVNLTAFPIKLIRICLKINIFLRKESTERDLDRLEGTEE